MDTPERTRRALRRALWWAPVSVYITTFLLIVIADVMFFETRRLTLALAFAVVAAELLRRFARRALLAGAREPSRWSERFAGVITLLLAGFIILSPGGFRTWSCPHGSGVRLGPVAVAHSTVGGPCRGQAPRQWMWEVWTNWYVVASPL